MNPSAIAALRDLEKLAEQLRRDGYPTTADRILAAVAKLKSSAKPTGGRR